MTRIIINIASLKLTFSLLVERTCTAHGYRVFLQQIHLNTAFDHKAPASPAAPAIIHNCAEEHGHVSVAQSAHGS